MSIRVVIADDHPVVRDGLRFSLERSGRDIRVVGDAADGREVLDMAAKTPADVYILDITMPLLNGMDTARELIRRNPAAKVIVLSLHDTRAMVEEALKSGARGYLTKQTASRNVAEAVSEVHAGRCFLSPDIARFVVESSLTRTRGPHGAKSAGTLTRQERKILQLIAEGHTTKEIAVQLGRAENTIHAHRNNLMAKLNLHKQADLVRYAIKEGIAKL